jgi:hypothetical protein
LTKRWRTGTVTLQSVLVETCWRPMEGDVAGDFFDVLDLGDGRAAVVIGDAPGHGPAAADLADALRAEIRRAFRESDDPVEVFERIDRFLTSSPAVQIATAACLIVDAPARQLRLVNAGHLPAVIVGPQRAEMLDAPADPLLGIRAQRRVQTLALPQGTAVMLYTDGLVERRGTPIDDSLAGLVELCSDLVGPYANAADLARRATERFGPPADDATVLWVRVAEGDVDRQVVVLRLYVDRRDLRTRQTEAILAELVDRLVDHLDVQVDVVDVADPEVDTTVFGVIATPTVVRMSPEPVVRVIGGLGSVADLARDLHLPLPPEDR